MDDFLKRTWLEIDLDAIRGNYQKIRSFVAPEAKVMAVIKADAYGHGVEYTAREMSGAGWIGLPYPIWKRQSRCVEPGSITLC